MRAIAGEINVIGWGSLAGVLVLAWIAFRSLRPVPLVGLSLLIGCAVALSVTALFFGKVHLLTLVFGTKSGGRGRGLWHSLFRVASGRAGSQTAC